MPDETIFCPECQAKVKVPDTLLGQAVTCPLCRHSFTAPIRGGGSIGPAPPARVAAAPANVASIVKTPAIALLLIGLLELTVSIMVLVRVVQQGPQALWLEQQQLFPKMPMPMDADALFQMMLWAYGVMTVFALGIILGAIQMLRMQNHGLAVIGSILAMLILGGCCCVAGLPIGIWSLTVLMRPEVKSAFQ